MVIEVEQKKNFTRLPTIRRFFGHTQKDVSHILGIDVMGVSGIERGIVKMKKQYERKLEKEYSLPPGAFTNEHVLPVPIMGEIAAGMPIFTERNFSEWVGLFDSNYDFGKIVAIRVEGNSMEPTIPNGALAYIKLTQDVQQGQVGAFLINEGATLKKLHQKHRECVVLRSLNPTYDDIVVDKQEKFEMIGPLVTVQFDWSEEYASESL